MRAMRQALITTGKRPRGNSGPSLPWSTTPARLATQQRVEAMTVERLASILATNVIGAFLCAREANRRMSHHHGGAGGSIVNVSSAASRLGAAGQYVDCAASKRARS